MDRRTVVKHAGLAGILAAGVAPAAHAQASIRWRLAHSFPKSLDTIYGTAEVFSKMVHDISGGKFNLSVHAAGELMPAFGVLDGGELSSNRLQWASRAHTAHEVAGDCRKPAADFLPFFPKKSKGAMGL